CRHHRCLGGSPAGHHRAGACEVCHEGWRGGEAMKRRDFVGAMGGSALALGAVTAPDLILWNGNIHTVDASGPHAEAVAIAGGRFVAVGSNGDIQRLATSRTKKVDLGARTVVPGFIDSHSHPASSGLRH